MGAAADALGECQACCAFAHKPSWAETWIFNFAPSLLGNAAAGGQFYFYCSCSDKPDVVEGFKPEGEGIYCSFIIITVFLCL